MRVLIADDHAAMRQSLVQALELEPDVEVVGEAPDGGARKEAPLSLFRLPVSCLLPVFL
jgi:DNA-binding NarL/FixJ family response regulator